MSPAASISPAIPRTALITGGAQRIGRAVTLALADAGFSVALHCHASVAAAEATRSAIPARPRPDPASGEPSLRPAPFLVIPSGCGPESATRTVTYPGS